MGKRIETLVPAVLLALIAVASNIPDSYAQSSSNFGPAVDSACQAFNGTTPFSDQSCALCHNTSNLGQRIDPEWTWWESGNLTAFCPDAPIPPPSPNQAPNGVIDAPAGNRTINAGDLVNFTGTGSDPDGDLPLSFAWDFGGGAANSNAQDPGSVTFNSVGTFTVTLTVTDNLGLSDPSPQSRTITVNDPTLPCTDADGDGFATEGGGCGQVDCNDTDASVNPDAPESCSDGIDNNCNSLTDVADPTAIDCPVSDSCFDNDGDRFSPDGGICGPIDCDDFDRAVNPGATEACDDDIDNDCDGTVDSDDPECNGSDCIGQRFPGDTPETPSVNVTRADWDEEDRELKVEGDQASDGALVTLSNAGTGDLLATEVAEDDGEWEFELDELAAVPCRVRVEIDGQSPAERSVSNAPSDCETGGGIEPPVEEPPVDEPSAEPAVNVSKADWDEEDRELKVEGDQASDGARVTLRNADTGDLLATEVAEDDGEWEFELDELAAVPCRVRVEIDGQSPAERSVSNAPSDCETGGGIEPPVEEPPVDEPSAEPAVNVSKADWDEEDRELKVEGDQASDGARVTLRNADTGDLLATEVAEGDGEWEFELDEPAAVPCRVRVEIDGQSPTERSVSNAPSDCEAGGII